MGSCPKSEAVLNDDIKNSRYLYKDTFCTEQYIEPAVIHYKFRQKEPYMSLDSFRKIRQIPPLSVIKFKIKLYSLQYSLVWWGFTATFLICTWHI